MNRSLEWLWLKGLSWSWGWRSNRGVYHHGWFGFVWTWWTQVVLLLCRKAIRKKEDWRIINLGKTTPPSTLEKFTGQKADKKTAGSFEVFFVMRITLLLLWWWLWWSWWSLSYISWFLPFFRQVVWYSYNLIGRHACTSAFQVRQKMVRSIFSNSRGDVAETLEDIANSIHGWSEGSKKRLEDALDELSFYDYHQLCTSLMLLKVEIGLGGTLRTTCTRWAGKFPTAIARMRVHMKIMGTLNVQTDHIARVDILSTFSWELNTTFALGFTVPTAPKLHSYMAMV